MKKIICLFLLVFVFLFSFIGCTNNGLKVKNVREDKALSRWVKGELENTSNKTYNEVWVHINYYNSDDTVIESFAIAYQVNPNSTVEFENPCPDEWDGNRYEIGKIEIIEY